ncbi:MAG: DedA family protein [Patescibacteria group bacterium]
MLNFIGALSQWSLNFLSQGGYLGIFLLSIADRITFQFIPGEVVFSLLGFLISQARFNFALGLLITVAGNFLGDAAIYLISMKGGRKLVDRFGRYFLISPHDLDHIEKLFEKHGGKFIFWGRFVPLVVTLISIPAGLAKMNFRKFSMYTILGSLPRNFILIFLGFKLGKNWPAVINFLQKSQYVIVFLLALALIWYIYRHLKHRHFSHN